VHSRLHVALLGHCECESVRALTSAITTLPAATEEGMTNRRQGVVGWLDRAPNTEWLFERIEHFGFDYARRHGIDVDALENPLQYVEYGCGTSFDWHIDTGTPDTLYRKVTISVQLTPGGAYSGGNLEFVGELGTHLRRLEGTATAFSSALGHRVTPITAGARAALVGWMCGPPYR